jgi:hypothetical protein
MIYGRLARRLDKRRIAGKLRHLYALATDLIAEADVALLTAGQELHGAVVDDAGADDVTRHDVPPVRPSTAVVEHHTRPMRIDHPLCGRCSIDEPHA